MLTSLSLVVRNALIRELNKEKTKTQLPIENTQSSEFLLFTSKCEIIPFLQRKLKHGDGK